MKSVHAETIYQDASEAEGICFFPQGPDFNCSTGTSTGNDGFTVRLRQQVIIQPNITGDSEIPISAVSFYIEHLGRGGSSWTGNAVLYDENNQSVATSTATSFGSVGEVKFNFATPYVLTEEHEITNIVVFTQVPGGGTYAAPYWGLTSEGYPPPGYTGFPQLWSGFYCYDTGCSSYTPNSALGYDYRITIYRNDTQLAFTSPENNTTVNTTPTPITGTCTTGLGVDLQVYNGVTYASSTESFGISLACSSNLWSTSVNLTQGYWNAFASSTGQTAGITFYFLAQSLLPTASSTVPIEEVNTIAEDLLNIPACAIPFLGWDPCTVLNGFINVMKTSLTSFFTAAWENEKNLRPYSYVYEVYTSMNYGFTNPTTTDALPAVNIEISATTSPYFAPQFDNLFVPSNVENIVPQSSWDTIRPFFNFVIYLVFLMWAWNWIRRT